jgi:hypothetical protein
MPYSFSLLHAATLEPPEMVVAASVEQMLSGLRGSGLADFEQLREALREVCGCCQEPLINPEMMTLVGQVFVD